MVQSVKHGIGKEDHTYTTYKRLNSRMPDHICQQKFGFESIELFQAYQNLPEVQKDKLLKKTLQEIKTYFSTLKWKYHSFENKAHFINITYKGIPKSERKDFGFIISDILKQIKSRILNFQFNQDYHSTGDMKLQFYLKNCGLGDQNVNTDNKEISIQNGSENRKMSIQKQNNNEDVNTKPKKETWIQIRIDENTKEIIKEYAKNQGYKSMSKYILNVLTNNKKTLANNQNVNTNHENVLTNNQTQKFKLCCQQLISLFDEIFEIQYPKAIVKKLLDLINEKIDSNLIDIVRGYLDE